MRALLNLFFAMILIHVASEYSVARNLDTRIKVSQPNGKYLVNKQSIESRTRTTFVLPGVPESNQVYQITPTGIKPIERRRRNEKILQHIRIYLI